MLINNLNYKCFPFMNSFLLLLVSLHLIIERRLFVENITFFGCCLLYVYRTLIFITFQLLLILNELPFPLLKQKMKKKAFSMESQRYIIHLFFFFGFYMK